MIRTLSDSIEGILAEGLSDFGRKPCKLCHSRGDSLPQAVFTFPASIHHRFFCNQDCLVVRFPHHIVNEDGHTFAQPHLEVLLMCHVTGLLAKMFHWQCLNHILDQRTKGGDCCSIESVHGGRYHGMRRSTRFAPVGWQQTASRATT